MASEIFNLDEIQKRIFTIRGLQVILDKDLAKFYKVKPIRLREQVRRNKKRFPIDFMFQLTIKEVESMVSQNAIPSKQHLGGALPFAFTEQGVAAISAVLTNDRAVEVNIAIMRAFVSMRRFLVANASVFQRLENIEYKQSAFKFETNKKICQIFKALENTDIKQKQGVFFDGQIFDAYHFVSDLIRTAKKSIVLIDNYVDDSVLILFSKRKKNVSLLVLTNFISKQLALDVKKYNTQYPSITIKEFKCAHDRFLILDDEIVYHLGASLKDLGKKWFAFSRFEKNAFQLIDRLSEINN